MLRSRIAPALQRPRYLEPISANPDGRHPLLKQELPAIQQRFLDPHPVV
jgi:hypothetical protein